MNRTWRFFMGSDHKWRWQILAFDQTVLEESAGRYKQYESCLADAEEHGYHFSPSLSTRPAQDPLRKQRKSYKFSKRPEKQSQATRETAKPGVADTKALTEVS